MKYKAQNQSVNQAT